MTSLIEDLEALEFEAQDVLDARNGLEMEILSGIKEYAIRNGSHVTTRALDGLGATLKHRVLSNFDGRHYERQGTHHQFKVVWDKTSDLLIIIDKQITAQHHVCKLEFQ